MSLPPLPVLLSAPILSPKNTRIPHLLFALTSKRTQPPAPQTQRRPASTKPARTLPNLPPRPAPPAHSPNNRTSPPRPLKPYLWAVGLFGATIGLYLSYYTASYLASQRHAASLPLAQNADVSSRWDRPDRDYDEEIEFSERAMFMGRKRRRLLGGENVRGRVLEVSCGTGRNFQWYDFEGRKGEEEGGIRELVFNDQSAVMLRVARGKWEALQRERRGKNEKTKNGGAFEGVVKGVVGDAGIRGVIARPEGGFDTIVQTMGVCSMQDPVAFLRQMNYLVRQPGEGGTDPDDLGGRILLLEHGRGHYDWINRLLDRGAVMHADRYGCWHNKDIAEVIKESGLKVGSVRRYHLGTTWEVVLRPNPELLRREDVPATARTAGVSVDEVDSKKSTSWWPW